MEKVINYLLFSVLELYIPKGVEGGNPYGRYHHLKRSQNTIALGLVTSHSLPINMFCGDQSLSSRGDTLSNRYLVL